MNPGVDDVALLQRGPQGPVDAVLEIHLALPLDDMREQVAIERGVVGQQPVEGQLTLGGNQLVEAHSVRRDLCPLPQAEAVVRIGPPIPD